MHPVTLAIPLFLDCVWFLDTDRMWGFVPCAVLVVLTGELLGVTLAALGIWYALARRRRRTGLLITVFGLGWTFVAVYVVVRVFSDGASPSTATTLPLADRPEAFWDRDPPSGQKSRQSPPGARGTTSSHFRFPWRGSSSLLQPCLPLHSRSSSQTASPISLSPGFRRRTTVRRSFRFSSLEPCSGSPESVHGAAGSRSRSWCSRPSRRFRRDHGRDFRPTPALVHDRRLVEAPRRAAQGRRARTGRSPAELEQQGRRASRRASVSHARPGVRTCKVGRRRHRGSLDRESSRAASGAAPRRPARFVSRLESSARWTRSSKRTVFWSSGAPTAANGRNSLRVERGFVHVDRAAGRELLRYAVIGATVVAVLALYALWTATVATPGLAIPKDIFGDFRTNVWSPGRAILDGRTPFRGYTADGASGTVYSPAAFVSTLLFPLPPFGVAAAVWLVAQLTSVVRTAPVWGSRLALLRACTREPAGRGRSPLRKRVARRHGRDCRDLGLA